MMDLFNSEHVSSKSAFAPLADRMRPQTLDEIAGQDHLAGPEGILRIMIAQGQFSSMIFWGPPGVGKTTLANILAHESNAHFINISAVTAGVKDIRQIIEQAKRNKLHSSKRTVLFIDEIHRFNKSQQDALLHAVEDGTLILIGATTENPSFEVNAPLLSRCRVYVLKAIEAHDIIHLLHTAMRQDKWLKQQAVSVPEEMLNLIATISAGDARNAYNILELGVQLVPSGSEKVLTHDIVQKVLQKRTLAYDKKGDAHYNTISAFIKSVRGSDPDAAVYYLARMLEAGEEPRFIARRLIILAAEDIGNADPFGLVLANAAFQSVHAVGMPEARIILSQAATYLASAPKSNAAYLAVDAAIAEVQKTGELSVPLHIRNAPAQLMKEMGYSKGYKYAHDYEGGFVEQQFLPDLIKDKVFYNPREIGREKTIKERLLFWWQKRNPAKE